MAPKRLQQKHVLDCIEQMGKRTGIEKGKNNAISYNTLKLHENMNSFIPVGDMVEQADHEDAIKKEESPHY